MTPAGLASHPGLIHGRVTMDDGTVYEGRLRWGGDEEALWTHHFNGRKVGKARPFLARFGDIARIETGLREIRVILKSGAASTLDRFEADDLADGLRIWDADRGVVDLGEWRIRTVEFLPGPAVGEGPRPLHGTVRTTQGDFTGFLQWDREAGLVTDTLVGMGPDGEFRVRFDAIAAIERRSPESALVTLVDGTALVLADTRHVGDGHRGVYVDDARYGRVLVSWDAFERVAFDDGGTGPGYDDFPIGRPLEGTVTTRSGDRLAGRIVYDLDERQTTETLDAPRRGIDYLITFDLIAAIELPGGGAGGPPARVTLRSGETVALERAGDLGSGNGGVQIFGEGDEDPRFVPWADVARIDLAG
ncbi:MAG: hypothetical protein RLN75_07455 [Longimicrobiales bacterium]